MKTSHLVGGSLALAAAGGSAMALTQTDACGNTVTITCESPISHSYTTAEVPVAGSASSCQQLITTPFVSPSGSNPWTLVDANTCTYDSYVTLVQPVTGVSVTTHMQLLMDMRSVDIPNYGTHICSSAEAGHPVHSGCTYNLYVCR